MSAVIESRSDLLKRGMVLEGIVVIYNIAEGIVAVGAGLLANSVALISFGIDSFAEVTSAIVVYLRLRHELLGEHPPEHIEKLERRTSKVAGLLLLGLAGYIIVGAGGRLIGIGEEAQESVLGIVLTAVSLLIMPVLGRAKLNTAKKLGSASLRADSFQTLTCAWMSLTLLVGLFFNALFGWAWADPIAALLIVPWILREGWNAWQGKMCQGCGIELSAPCRSNQTINEEGRF